jgi:hypothetical protein
VLVQSQESLEVLECPVFQAPGILEFLGIPVDLEGLAILAILVCPAFLGVPGILADPEGLCFH